MANIAGILLAGGSSQRFGGNKLVALIEDGRSIGRRSAEQLQAALGNVLVVVPEGNVATLGVFEGVFEVSVCADSRDGIGRSIAHGIAARPDADGWLIGLADMPYIQVETIRMLASALISELTIVRPRWFGRVGHPVGFGASYSGKLKNLQGDQGAQSIVDSHTDSLVLIDTKDSGVVLDIDRPEDIRHK
tara:strand:+ start:293 stop:862 length:570 start_codon:yes stop_codon:yes gene_type:complete